jgi:hypothetical protein
MTPSIRRFNPQDKILVLASSVSVALLAGFHALMATLANAPPSAITRDFSPTIKWYAGPWVTQNWSLFAPAAPTTNLRVIVRGKRGDGTVTPWYDATLFFLTEMHANRFTASRPVSEGLFHSALIVSEHGVLQPESRVGVVLIRTSAMVLQQYQGHPRYIQVEIDSSTIDAGVATGSAQRKRLLRSHWLDFPSPVTF